MDEVEISNVINNNKTLNYNQRNKSVDGLHIDKREKDILIFQLGIQTISKLLFTDPKILQKSLHNYPRFVRMLYQNDHLILESDIKRLDSYNLHPVVAYTPLWATNLSVKIVNSLIKAKNICFLGDLINTDYNIIAKIPNIGEKALVEIKKYIHGLGYSLPNEEIVLSELIEQKISNGEKLIGDIYSVDKRLLMVLYKNDIFTQEDIKNYGFNLFNLPGHTTITRGLLIEFLQNNHFINNNIQIDDGTKEDDYSESFDSINTQMTIINNQIRKRVTEKEALLREYKAKQKEKEQLIEKEKQLDMQLKQLISEGTKFITEEDKGEKYDRK